MTDDRRRFLRETLDMAQAVASQAFAANGPTAVQRQALRVVFVCAAFYAAAATLVLLAASLCAAQSDAPLSAADMMEGYGDDVWGDYYDPRNNVYLHFNHRLETYGSPGQVGLGLTKHFLMPDGVFTVDAQYNLDYNSDQGVDLGFVRRWYDEARGRILGASFWWDGDETDLDNFFHQFGLGAELLTDDWDLRGNAYFPLGSRVETGKSQPVSVGDLTYFDHFIGTQTRTMADVALLALEAEIARRLFSRNLWVFGGAYYLEGGGESTVGYKAGFRGWVLEDLAMHITVTDDEFFKTKVNFGLTWYIGRCQALPMAPVQLHDRLYERVIRNDYVAVRRTELIGQEALTYTDGAPVRLVHVDSAAAPGGDGTFEAPLNNLNDIFANSLNRDIVLMHAGSVFDGQSVQLRDDQRLLGEGVTGGHTVATAQFGTIALLETSPGALAGPVPIVQNAPGTAAVRLANRNEVSGFTIDGGAGVDTRGIAALAGATGTNVNRMTIENMPGNGIEITPSTNTAIDNVLFNNIGGDDIVLNAHNTTITRITSNNPNGVGIRLSNATGTTIIDDYIYRGGATGDGAIRLVSPNGNVSITDVDIEYTTGTGFGLFASNGSANLTVNRFEFDGGTSAGHAIEVTAPQGTLSIANATVANGAGRGIRLANNQATSASISNYNYNGGSTGAGGLLISSATSAVSVNQATITGGVGPGVDVHNGSAALSFAGMNVSNTGDAAFRVSGGTSSIDYRGNISQANNASTIAVTNHSTGTMTFQLGTISATNGNGLQFSNADGSYQISSTLTLNGGDAGVDIFNDSSGTFSLSIGTITNPTGTAFRIDGGSPIVSYGGTITNNAGRAVVVENITGGNINFAGSVTDTAEGILVQNNSGGIIAFNGLVNLNTGANDAVNLLNNTGAEIRFTQMDINTTSGGGFTAIGGGVLRISGSTNTINTQTGVGLRIENMEISASGAAFRRISVDGAPNGIVINNTTGGEILVGVGGSLVGNGGVLQNTTSHAVEITNARNVSLNYLDIQNSGGDGVRLTHNNNAQFSAALRNSRINVTAGDGVSLAATGSAPTTVSILDNNMSNLGNRGIVLDVDDDAVTANMTVNRNNVVTDDASGLLVRIHGAGIKTANFLADQNTFVNASDTHATAVFLAENNTTLNASVFSNVFTNTGAAVEYTMETVHGGSQIRLNLDDNTADGGGGFFELTRTAGTFGVVDRDNTDANNNGTVNFNPNIGSFTNIGSVPTP